MKRVFAFLYESKGTHTRKDVFPTPMVVKTYLSSSISYYILTKIVYLMADFTAFFVVLLLFLVLDLIFFHVICSFQDISGWKLRKIAWNRRRTQKANSYT